MLSVNVYDNVLSAEYDAEHVEKAGSNIRNYYKVDGAQSKRGGAKNIKCIFCDTSLAGRAFLVQKKANVGACVPIRKKDNNWYVEFNIVQKILNKEMMAKEWLLSCSQAKKSVLDSMTYSGKGTVTGDMNLKLIVSETLDSTIVL